MTLGKKVVGLEHTVHTVCAVHAYGSMAKAPRSFPRFPSSDCIRNRSPHFIVHSLLRASLETRQPSKQPHIKPLFDVERCLAVHKSFVSAHWLLFIRHAYFTSAYYFIIRKHNELNHHIRKQIYTNSNQNKIQWFLSSLQTMHEA